MQYSIFYKPSNFYSYLRADNCGALLVSFTCFLYLDIRFIYNFHSLDPLNVLVLESFSGNPRLREVVVHINVGRETQTLPLDR